MLGFSFPKLLLLALIIAVIWYGFKMFSRGKDLANPRGPGGKDKVKQDKMPDSVDMVQCSVCGDYVAKGAAACGKDNCPN